MKVGVAVVKLNCSCSLEKRFIMDVFEAVRTVLAVRQYQDKPIPQSVVDKIVESAHLTASSINGQPWHFVVVQDKEMLRQLGTLVKSGPYIAQAPLAIVVGMEESPYAVSDASRAIQSMVLTAWEEGVGSNWTGYENLPQVNPVLGIPEEIKILAVLPFGYPVANIGKGKKKRKPLGQVVSRERWGQPYE
jgi:nitroreductase